MMTDFDVKEATAQNSLIGRLLNSPLAAELQAKADEAAERERRVAEFKAFEIRYKEQRGPLAAQIQEAEQEMLSAKAAFEAARLKHQRLGERASSLQATYLEKKSVALRGPRR